MNQLSPVRNYYKSLTGLAVEVDKMTKQLPKHEFWEEGFDTQATQPFASLKGKL